jgi:hypothetical protein
MWQSYSWFEWETATLAELVQACPRLIVGQRVVVAAYDSGPLELAEEETDRGWRREGAVAISPVISSATREIPIGEYDEWWIFETLPTDLEAIEPVVNYSSFRLACREPDPTSNKTWDRQGAAAAHESREALRQRLWRSVERLSPKGVVIHGDRLTVISGTPHVVACLSDWVAGE